MNELEHPQEKSLTTPIGILGGTFDPVHLGHINMAKLVLEALPLSKILFVPCKQQVLKKEKPGASAEQRLAMLKLALENENGLAIDDREITRDTPSYMIDTLRSLQTEAPNTPLCLIIGMDSFLQLPQWHQWQSLFSHCHLIVINRNGSELKEADDLQKQYHQNIITDPAKLTEKRAGTIFFYTIVPIPISATKIRENLAQGKEQSTLLPASVWDHIQAHHLYQT